MPPRTRTVPRKMPKQQRSKETVDVILAATARVLVKEGFDRASTNRIADAAGVSIGSLYQYFPSKEALVAALVERHIETMSEALAGGDGARWPTRRWPSAVRRMVTLMLDAHAIEPELHRVLNEQVPRVGRLHRVHEVEARMQRLARAYFERRRERAARRARSRHRGVRGGADDRGAHARRDDPRRGRRRRATRSSRR